MDAIIVSNSLSLSTCVIHISNLSIVLVIELEIALYGSLSIHLVEVISAIILMVACGKVRCQTL